MIQKKYLPNVIVEDTTRLTREEWLQKRKCGIGGSDLAKILGISPFGTNKDVYWEKLGYQNIEQEENNWIAKEVGNRLESLIIQIFMKKNPGWKVYLIKKMLSHPDYPWMIADLDGITIDPRTGQTYVLEIKTCSVNALDKWGERNSNEIPPEYQCQGRHYMAVTHAVGTIFVCLGGNQEWGYRQRYLMRDLKKEKEIIEAEHDFWINHVKNGLEPLYNDSQKADLIIDSLKSHYKKRNDVRKIPDALLQNMKLVKSYTDEIANLEKQKRKLEESKKKAMIPIMEYLQGADGLAEIDNETYRLTSVKRTLTNIKVDDLSSLMLNYPDVYKQYVKSSTSESWKIKKEKK